LPPLYKNMRNEKGKKWNDGQLLRMQKERMKELLLKKLYNKSSREKAIIISKINYCINNEL